MMEERYHATTQNRFYPDMSNVNKNITVEAKLISPPTYITNKRVPRSEHSTLRLYKSSLLMLYKAKVVGCFEICTKHTNAVEHLAEFFNVKFGGT